MSLERAGSSRGRVFRLSEAPYPPFPFVLSEVGWRAVSASSNAVEGRAAGERPPLREWVCKASNNRKTLRPRHSPLANRLELMYHIDAHTQPASYQVINPTEAATPKKRKCTEMTKTFQNMAPDHIRNHTHPLQPSYTRPDLSPPMAVLLETPSPRRHAATQSLSAPKLAPEAKRGNAASSRYKKIILRYDPRRTPDTGPRHLSLQPATNLCDTLPHIPS